MCCNINEQRYAAGAGFIWYLRHFSERRVGVKRQKLGGMVNVVYVCEEENHVWANGEIWAAGVSCRRKGNVNSSELTNVPEGYKLKEVGDFYYDGGSELRIQIVPWYR